MRYFRINASKPYLNSFFSYNFFLILTKLWAWPNSALVCIHYSGLKFCVQIYLNTYIFFRPLQLLYGPKSKVYLWTSIFLWFFKQQWGLFGLFWTGWPTTYDFMDGWKRRACENRSWLTTYFEKWNTYISSICPHRFLIPNSWARVPLYCVQWLWNYSQ